MFRNIISAYLCSSKHFHPMVLRYNYDGNRFEAFYERKTRTWCDSGRQGCTLLNKRVFNTFQFPQWSYIIPQQVYNNVPSEFFDRYFVQYLKVCIFGYSFFFVISILPITIGIKVFKWTVD